MDALEVVEIVESEIIEDGICDMCDEIAMPYDANTEDPYCARHQMSFWTGTTLEDLTDTDPEYFEAYQVHRLTQPITDTGMCYCAGCSDINSSSRINQADSFLPTVIACTECAVRIFIPVAMWELEDWQFQLVEEIMVGA